MSATVQTFHGAELDLSDEALTELRSSLRGAALTPDDDGYENVRAPFNAMHADRPSLVVRCTGTADVVAAVDFARERGIALTIRGGGHSIAGLSASDGGMVVDLSSMRAVAVDPDARLARVQGGAVLGDLDRETQVFGLATPTGAVSETGIAGLTLGGGYGWLRRKYGLSCDNVVAAQVVCADGEVRTASEEENPDLFWALRGGGGNFGIVTSFTFRLHSVGPIVPFVGVFYRLADASEALRGFRDFALEAPDEITAEAIPIASRMPADPHLPEAVHGEQCLIVGAVYAGDSTGGMDLLRPLRELATPLADISQPMAFTAVQSAFDGFFPRGQLRAYWKSAYLAELSDDVVDVIASRTYERPSGRSAFELVYMDVYPMGGAVGRVAPEATAFGERTAPWLVAVDANWTDSTDDEGSIAWVRESWDELDERFGTGATYLNFSGRTPDEGEADVNEAPGRNLRRLGEIKAVYDPDNFFRRNNNIAPAA